jgi:hypothetical protein
MANGMVDSRELIASGRLTEQNYTALVWAALGCEDCFQILLALMAQDILVAVIRQLSILFLCLHYCVQLVSRSTSLRTRKYCVGGHSLYRTNKRKIGFRKHHDIADRASDGCCSYK